MMFEFNSGDTNSVWSAEIRTTGTLSISRVVLRGNNPQKNDVIVTLTIRDGGSTYTGTAAAAAEADFEAVFDAAFTSAEDANINLSASASGITMWGGPVRSSEKMLKGAGAYVSSSNMFNCEITAIGEQYWQTGASGYVELAQNPFRPWTDWERNENGHPLNGSVWKTDSNNYGFPWIFGFEGAVPVIGQILINTAEGLMPYAVYLNTGRELTAVEIYFNTETGLVPLKNNNN